MVGLARGSETRCKDTVRAEKETKAGHESLGVVTCALTRLLNVGTRSDPPLLDRSRRVSIT